MRAEEPSAQRLFLHVGRMIIEPITYKGMIQHGSGGGCLEIISSCIFLSRLNATRWNDEIGCVAQHTTFLYGLP